MTAVVLLVRDPGDLEKKISPTGWKRFEFPDEESGWKAYQDAIKAGLEARAEKVKKKDETVPEGT